MNVVKTVGRCLDVWRKTEGEGGAGKERKGKGHAGRGFSYSMPPVPRTRPARGGTASPSFCCAFKESCVTIRTMITVCSLLTLRPGTVRLSYSNFTTWFFQPKISRYLSPVTELRLLHSGHRVLLFEFEYITPLSTQHSTDAWHNLLCSVCCYRECNNLSIGGS